MSKVTNSTPIDADFRRPRLRGDTTNYEYGNVPASASADGVAGEFAFDDSYAYFCYKDSTWLKVAIATWS